MQEIVYLICNGGDIEEAKEKPIDDRQVHVRFGLDYFHAVFPD